MITLINDYISVTEFAGLCQINNKAVHERIQRGQLAGIWLDGIFFVNKNHSLIVNRLTKKVIQQNMGKSTVQNPDILSAHGYIAANLVSVQHYAKRLQIRTDSVYERIIRNEMDACVVAGRVFVDQKKYPVSQYIFSRNLSRNRSQI